LCDHFLHLVFPTGGCCPSPCAHQEVHHDRLHLRLAGLEVVTADVHLVLLRQLDHAGHEGVLQKQRRNAHRCQNRSLGTDASNQIQHCEHAEKPTSGTPKPAKACT